MVFGFISFGMRARESRLNFWYVLPSISFDAVHRHFTDGTITIFRASFFK